MQCLRGQVKVLMLVAMAVGTSATQAAVAQTGEAFHPSQYHLSYPLDGIAEDDSRRRLSRLRDAGEESQSLGWSSSKLGMMVPADIEQGDGNGIEVRTSLQRMRAAYGVSVLAINPGLERVRVPRSRWDGWMHYRAGKDGSALSMFRAGADYVESERGLAGIALEYDRWSGSATNGGLARQAGWRISPYMTRKLDHGFLLDSQISLGRSSRGRVADPHGPSGPAHRVAVFASLTGSAPSAGWTLSPNLRLSYSSERPANGLSGQDLAEGELRLGPSLSRDVSLANGAKLEPALKLDWVFNHEKDVGTEPTSQWSTASEAVLGIVKDNGVRLTFAAGRSRADANSRPEPSYRFQMQIPLR